MEARFIGPESELGAVHVLDFFGNKLTREWSEVDFTAEALAKAEGNKYIEVRGAPNKEDAAAEVKEDETRSVLEARLTELGVDHRPGESLQALRGKLDKAEKAAAKADEEAQAAAEKLAGETTSGL